MSIILRYKAKRSNWSLSGDAAGFFKSREGAE